MQRVKQIFAFGSRYLASERARSHVTIGTGVTSFGVYCLFYFPESHFIERSRRLVQMYKNGVPVKPTEKILEFASEILAELEMEKSKARKLRWFTSFGFEPIHFGSVEIKQGAVIGLPSTVYYNSTDDVDRAGIKMHRNKSIPWSSEAGQALIDALILSDEAKKFLIAREIRGVQTMAPMILPLCTSLPVLSIPLLAQVFNDKVGMFRRPLWYRFLFHAGWLALCIALGTAAHDFVMRYYERDADEEVAVLGDTYVRGGIEYYSKELLRNKALRELLGPEGEKSYNANGDVIHRFRLSHLPISERKAYLEGLLNPTDGEEEEVSDKKRSVK